MSNHYLDIVKEEAKAADSVIDIHKPATIQRWGLSIAVIAFVFSLVLYSTMFHGGLSEDQATWGQFGDFMGGVVNPIIGLCTIWLLTVSLNQANMALKQANDAIAVSHNELTLTRAAVEDARNMQATTEAALNAQTNIAANARDMNNAIALYQELDRQYIGIGQQLELDIKLLGETAGSVRSMKEYLELY